MSGDDPGRYYQFSLSSGQLVATFVGAVVLLAGAFFFGFATARGVPPVEVAPPVPVESENAAPIAPSSEPTASASVEPEVAEPVEEPPAPVKTTPEPEPATATPTTSSPAKAAEPAPTKTPAAADDRPEPGTFSVQVAALSTKGDAESFRKKLAARGYNVWVRQDPATAKTPWKVWVGKFRTRDDADRMAARLEGAEKDVPHAYVVAW